MRCKFCNGILMVLGTLGTADYYRCRHCHMEWILDSADEGTYHERRENWPEHAKHC